MSRERLKIAVLITCYNRRENTLGCLRKIYTQTGLSKDFFLDVFLVDDGSTDGTAEAVKKEFEQVQVITGSGKLYWNRGMNLAWKVAAEKSDYDYYLWLNDDTELFSDAIAELLKAETSYNKIALVCGAISSRYDGKFTYGGVSRNSKPVIPNGEIQNCYIINGNCVLVSREVFKSVGNIDPVFPHAIGDHDYGLRLLRAGGYIITTGKFVGFCERNARLPKWCYSETPFKERVKALYSPLGNSHPYYYFIYERRHFGLGLAIKHYLSIHLRVLYPLLWKR